MNSNIFDDSTKPILSVNELESMKLLICSDFFAILVSFTPFISSNCFLPMALYSGNVTLLNQGLDSLAEN